MIIYVHAYDMFDAGTRWGRHNGVDDVAQVVTRPHDTIPAVVTKIAVAARAERSIFTLIINAHGMTDSEGRPVGEISLSDAAVLTPSTALRMAPLRPYFSSPCNGVELHSCEVLQAREGWHLCQVLARELAVAVYASVAYQRGISPSWSSTRSDMRGRFEGSTMRFNPDGSYVNAVPELLERGLHSAS